MFYKYILIDIIIQAYFILRTMSMMLRYIVNTKYILNKIKKPKLNFKLITIKLNNTWTTLGYLSTFF